MNRNPSFPPRVFATAYIKKSAITISSVILDLLYKFNAMIVTSPTQGKQELNHGGQAFMRLPAF